MSGDTDTSNSYDRMDSGEESEDLEDSGEECGFAEAGCQVLLAANFIGL